MVTVVVTGAAAELAAAGAAAAMPGAAIMPGAMTMGFIMAPTVTFLGEVPRVPRGTGVSAAAGVCCREVSPT